MAKAKFEFCTACPIRALVAERLEWPPHKPAIVGLRESPTAFWARVEAAGLLSEALALYDRLAAEQAAWAHTRRETKEEFALRIQKEGRQAEAERLRAQLMASGLSEREVQAELVARLQPLDGSKTRFWPTPNPWNAGRLFRKKADQDRMVALANRDERRTGTEDAAVAEAKKRLSCANHRLEERRALLAARQRAKAMKAAVPKTPKTTAGTEAPASRPEPASCLRCSGKNGVHHQHCPDFVPGQTPEPCYDCQRAVLPSSPTYGRRFDRVHCDDCRAKRKAAGWPY